MNNAAAARARGRLLVFVNNDVEAFQADWLSLMAREALRPEVGAVGAKLLDGAGRIQHGGIVLGTGGGLVTHGHRHFAGDAFGYLSALRATHAVSAVTAACLVVEATKFKAVGGFDDDTFAVDFNDVDLCLRLNQAGYRTLLVPGAVLHHREAASRRWTPAARARHEAEIVALKKRWGPLLAQDPHYPSGLRPRSFDPRAFARRVSGIGARAPAALLNEPGPAGLHLLVLGHDAQPLGDLGIGLDQAAEILAEAVLVELVRRLDVPTGGTNRVRSRRRRRCASCRPPTGDPVSILKSTSRMPTPKNRPDRKSLDADRERHDVVDLLRRRPAESGDVLFRDHRVVERVVLVVELDDRRAAAACPPPARGGVASEPAATLRTTTSSGTISTSRISCSRMLSRRMKCVGTPMSLRCWKMNSEIRLFSTPLPSMISCFFAFERGRVVLEVLDERPGLGPLVEDLRLALVDATAAVHRRGPWFEEVHGPRLLMREQWEESAARRLDAGSGGRGAKLAEAGWQSTTR